MNLARDQLSLMEYYHFLVEETPDIELTEEIKSHFHRLEMLNENCCLNLF